MSELDLSQHPDTVTCRHCNKKVVKTFGKISNDGRTLWVNEFGDRWYGTKCPNCYKNYKLQYDKKNRLDKGFRPLGSKDSCITCGKHFIVKIGATKQCTDCKAKNTRKQMGHED